MRRLEERVHLAPAENQTPAISKPKEREKPSFVSSPPTTEEEAPPTDNSRKVPWRWIALIGVPLILIGLWRAVSYQPKEVQATDQTAERSADTLQQAEDPQSIAAEDSPVDDSTPEISPSQVIGDYVDGVAIYRTAGGSMGLVNASGQPLGRTYDKVEALANGYAVFHQNDRRGYLSLEDGRVAIEAQYRAAWRFERNGRAKVKTQSGQIQYINTEGDCVQGCETAITQNTTPQNTDLIPLPRMIRISGGSFEMRSNDSDAYDSEKPVHTVRVASFHLSETEVTFAQYDYFCEQTGRSKPDDEGWGRGNRPVINVSWNDAQAYCQWVSQQTGQRYRLPTEAEWEYAAGGGSSGRTKWAGTSSSGSLGSYAVYSSNSGIQTSPVKSKRPNSLGLYDMSGNVWEWCEDKWHDNYQGAPTNGSAWTSGSSSYRVFRGGSWLNPARGCRVAYRGRSSPTDRSDGLGFRLALSS